MSTNRKNNRDKRDKAVLRNWVKPQSIAQRTLLNVEDQLLDNSTLNEIVDGINEAIQEINRSVRERNIPYVRLNQSKETFNLDKTRVLLRSERSDNRILEDIEDAIEASAENTFLVEFYLNDNGYVEIGYADGTNLEPMNLSNFILVDRESLPCALADIFLDSAMFNSYSFLCKLQPEQKRELNRSKVDFLKLKYHDFTKLDSPFYVFNSDDYKYLSMAFFARKSENSIDLEQLVEMWNEFTYFAFPNSIHVEPPVRDQLEALVDLEQYTQKTRTACANLETGTYWLLRIHRAPVNEQVKAWLEAVFGKAEIGEEKIITFDAFASVLPLVKEQHITAFKLVVD